MRFKAPARDQVDPVVFDQLPLSEWRAFDDWLRSPHWPDVAALNERRAASTPRFVAQTRALEAEQLHYELRIAQRNEISTREQNWHDLLNAMIWLRYPQLKAALNARQVREIATVGTKSRTRAQDALTQFDEAGVIVILRDASLVRLWDAHDWHGLFWQARAAWQCGAARAVVFGHALLEHALRPKQLLVGKAIPVIDAASASDERVIDVIAAGIEQARLLNDPQELRPLPISGIPGWCAETANENFYRTGDCFRPLRAGRRYPAPMML